MTGNWETKYLVRRNGFLSLLRYCLKSFFSSFQLYITGLNTVYKRIQNSFHNQSTLLSQQNIKNVGSLSIALLQTWLLKAETFQRSSKIIPVDQRKCAISEKIMGGSGPRALPLNPPLKPQRFHHVDKRLSQALLPDQARR